MIALTLEEIEHLRLLLVYDNRTFNFAPLPPDYWRQHDTIIEILLAEQRSLEQAMKGGDRSMPKAAKKKPVAKPKGPIGKKVKGKK